MSPLFHRGHGFQQFWQCILPKILADTFTNSNRFQIGLLVAIPSTAAIILMVSVAMHSDRTGERRWHVALPAFLAAAGWVLVAWMQEPYLVLLGLMLAQAGMLSMLAPFWSLPTAFLSGTGLPGGSPSSTRSATSAASWLPMSLAK